MKRLIQIILLFQFFTVLWSQEELTSYDYLERSFIDSTVFKKESSIKPIKKATIGLNAGMSYSISSGGYGGSFYSISPHVNYPLNNRFSVTVGMSMGYGSIYNPYFSENSEDPMLPMTRMFIYTSGNYQISDRLTVNGSVYKQVIDVSNRDSDQAITNFDTQGAVVGFQYKITPNISFGAQIRIEDAGFYQPYNSLRNSYGNMYGPNWW